MVFASTQPISEEGRCIGVGMLCWEF